MQKTLAILYFFSEEKVKLLDYIWTMQIRQKRWKRFWDICYNTWWRFRQASALAHSFG